MVPAIPIVSRSQMKAIENSLQQEIWAVGKVYGKLYQYAVKIMRTHAPEGVVPMVNNVVANMLFFDTVGLMGACGVKSGELKIPQDDFPVAVMIVKE